MEVPENQGRTIKLNKKYEYFFFFSKVVVTYGSFNSKISFGFWLNIVDILQANDEFSEGIKYLLTTA